MKKNKVIGFLLMLLALLAPIYMFGNMSIKQIFQNFTYNKYIDKFSSIQVENILQTQEEITKYKEKIDSSNSNIIDPFNSENYNSIYSIEKNDKDFIFGYINIPKLDKKYPLRLGTSDYNIRNGMGHIDGTSLPDFGENSRSVIAVHRVTSTDIMFYYADTITTGDELILDLGYKVIVYKYKNTEIIDPSEWERLLPVKGEEIITILTCDPPYPPFSKRMLINFVKDKEYFSKKIVKELEEKDKLNQINFVDKKVEILDREDLNNLFLSEESRQSTSAMFIIVTILFFIFTILFVTILIKLVRYVKNRK